MNLIYTNIWCFGSCRIDRTWTYYMDLSSRLVAASLPNLKKYTKQAPKQFQIFNGRVYNT